jgi:hypothetical protein
LKRRVERVLVNGAGRLRESIARKAMRQIGRAMRRRNSAAVIVTAMVLAVVVAEVEISVEVKGEVKLL